MIVTGNKILEQGRQRIRLLSLYYLLVSWAAVIVVVAASKEAPPSSCFESLCTPSRRRLAKTIPRKSRSRTSTTASTVERWNDRLQNGGCYESVCAVRGGATTDEANTDGGATSTTIDDSSSVTTVGGETTAPAEANENGSTESVTSGDVDVTNNDEDETTTATTTTTTSVMAPQDLDEIRELATQLRLQGREFHDQADFAQAASFFQKAADMLLPVLVGLEASLPGDSSSIGGNAETQEMLDEFSTCRLHEALCRLKGNEYEKCIDACTNFLDGAGGQLSTTSSTSSSSSARVVRARAYHRRAKAKLGLQDTSGALEDARSAAFLGDRKAVALYGRLMRESSSSYGGSASVDAMSATMERMLSSSSSLGSGSSASSSLSLFESLLSKSGSSTSSTSSPGASSLFGDFSPAAMLLGKNPLDFLTGGKDGAAGGGGKLAKSVLQSLSKRLEEESTQDTICGYLQGTNKAQLTQLAAMAGAGNALSGKQIDKVVDFCHGVTPKTIRRTVRTTKGVIYVVQIFRRILKILTKYKSLIAAIIFLQWTKSAVLRPLPINKAAAKRALKDAMKANRPTKPKKK
jgi:hypothetical protein